MSIHSRRFLNLSVSDVNVKDLPVNFRFSRTSFWHCRTLHCLTFDLCSLDTRVQHSAVGWLWWQSLSLPPRYIVPVKSACKRGRPYMAKQLGCQKIAKIPLSKSSGSCCCRRWSAETSSAITWGRSSPNTCSRRRIFWWPWWTLTTAWAFCCSAA